MVDKKKKYRSAQISKASKIEEKRDIIRSSPILSSSFVKSTVSVRNCRSQSVTLLYKGGNVTMFGGELRELPLVVLESKHFKELCGKEVLRLE